MAGRARFVPVGMLLAALLPGCSDRTTATDSPSGEVAPPVVLVSIDTLRADHLPAWGYEGVETPHLDRLAEDSTVFLNAWAPCPLTLPSHVSLLSGLRPQEHGVRSNLGYSLAESVAPWLPTVLRTAGYRTGAAVSAQVLRSRTGLGRGFDYFDDDIRSRSGEHLGSLHRPGPETVAAALEWVGEQAGRPFFLFLHLFEPHAPYEPPEPYRSRYTNPYDGEIAAVDRVLGVFLDRLRDLGVYDRALIIVVGDHGEGLGDHGEDEHGIFLYREAIHVPLLLKPANGRGAGVRDARTVDLVDVTPTVLQAAGLEARSGLAGRSLLSPGPGEGERLVLAETLYPRLHLGWSELRSVVGAGYHYIEAPQPELFDLGEDPEERRNLLAEGVENLDQPARAALSRFEGLLSGCPLRLDEPAEVDPEDAAQLAALGYLSAPAAGARGALPDPKQGINSLGDMQEATRMTMEGRHREAIPLLRRVVGQSPFFTDAWTVLAASLAAIGERDEACEIYRRLMVQQPRLEMNFALPLARASLELGRLDEAEAMARRAMGLDPGAANETLARVALARGDLERAEQRAKIAAGVRGHELGASVVLAQAWARQGRVEEALAVLEETATRADRLGERVPRLHFARGDLLAVLGRGEEAAAAFRAEIALEPRALPAYGRLAVVLAVEGRPDEAQAVLDEMVAANPTRAACELAARTHEMFEDHEGAARWRERAGEMAE